MKFVILFVHLIMISSLITGCDFATQQDHQRKTLRFTSEDYTPNKVVKVDSAVVVTAHPIATKIGLETLKKGGNAIDAMVAVQFALAVV